MLSFQRQLAVGKEGERQGLQMFHFLSLAIAESVVSRLQQGRHDLKGGRETEENAPHFGTASGPVNCLVLSCHSLL